MPRLSCPQCAAENPSESRFCEACGTNLAQTCGGCGASLSANARFCRQCGRAVAEAAAAGARFASPQAYTPKHLADKILTARGAVQGERKQVTVLFADVQGSMDLAEQVDAEAWHRIMDGFFAVLAEGVHRFEGTVNQYTGDGIMALFGAPIAHEDHAQRACYAALHLRDRLAEYANELRRTRGMNFSVRMGLNSGEVVVGAIGDDLRMDYTAQGHTVGLAARMEALAESGRVYLTERTHALVEGYFELQDLGSFTVKGVAAPLHVFDLTGAGGHRSRFDIARTRGLSRFVGRSKEMALLEQALERGMAGERTAVALVAAAGVGKSRLCHEFAEQGRARGVRVIRTQGVSHGRNIPLLPFLMLYRDNFGVQDGDSDDVARQKIAGGVTLLDPALHEVLPAFFEIMGVPDPARPAPPLDPEARQQQLLSIARRLSIARAQQEPAVVIFEDLHWFDQASLAVMRGLFLDPETSQRGLILVNYRPEFTLSWIDEMPEGTVQEVALAPLERADAGELLVDLLGSDPSLGDLAVQLIARTRGNPFYLEEAVRTIVESGDLVGERGAYQRARPEVAITIPATVHAVLAARIDRLPEGDKAVLQTAAVIGKQFAWPVLREVVGIPEDALWASIGRLVEAEFLYQEALYPEPEYVFAHPLTREVAYGSQLSDARAAVHAAVAMAMRDLYGDAADDRAALLAHHYEYSGDGLEAARFHRRAAEWAGQSAPAEAVRHWRRVFELADKLPESPDTLTLRVAGRAQTLYLGWGTGLSDAEADRLYSEAATLADQLGDPRESAVLLDAYGRVQSGRGEVTAAVALRTEALYLATLADDLVLKLGLLTRLAGAHHMAGRMQEALELTEQALAEVGDSEQVNERVLGFNPYLRFLMRRGTVLSQMGRLAESRSDLDRALTLAREQNDRETLTSTHAFYVYLADLLGERDSASHHARRAVELAEEIGVPYFRAVAYAALGHAHWMRGEWDASLEATARALEEARTGRTFQQGEPLMLRLQAEALLGRGDVARAETVAQEAISLARRRGTRYFEGAALLCAAHVGIRSADPAKRERCGALLEDSMIIARETGTVTSEPHIREALADWARCTGDEEGYVRELRKAHRLYTEIGAPLRAAEVEALLQAATGAPEAAS